MKKNINNTIKSFLVTYGCLSLAADIVNIGWKAVEAWKKQKEKAAEAGEQECKCENCSCKEQCDSCDSFEEEGDIEVETEKTKTQEED